MTAKLSLILARADNGVIGKEGALPWRLPEDMRHFKALTMGKPCIMGRKTWESLPAKFRPLPGRANLVVTRQTGFPAPGARAAPSLEAALAAVPEAEEVLVIGGAMLYAAALPAACRIYLTEIHAEYDGDAFAPDFPAAEWRESARENGTSGDLAYSFVMLERVSSFAQGCRIG